MELTGGFIYEIQKICNLEKEIAKYDLEDLPIELLREAKVNGFSDEQISRIMEHGDEEDVYNKRKAAGITRVFKMVDTCSAEFEAKHHISIPLLKTNLPEAIRN